MLRTTSLITVLITSLLLTVSCASKKKTGQEEGVGGTEGAPMESNVASKDMNYDSMGSDSGNINGLQTVHFELDSSALSTDVRRQLAANAEWIKANVNSTVQVEGHCDNRGSVEYNLSLGERRAKAVKNYLVGLGVDSKRLTIISYGEEKPLVPGDNESAFSQNRRANFVPIAQ